MLVDDHPGSRLAREANVIALLFRMEEDSHYPTVVSVGPPGYGKINGDDMLAHVIPLTWEAPPICVNEVRGDHLTTRAMYTLTGSELPNLKYSGELAIGRHHWLVMVPPCVSLIGLHDIVTVARMQPPVERAANPIGVRIESTFRHLNRHPDCQCAWTRWARL